MTILEAQIQHNSPNGIDYFRLPLILLCGIALVGIIWILATLFFNRKKMKISKFILQFANLISATIFIIGTIVIQTSNIHRPITITYYLSLAAVLFALPAITILRQTLDASVLHMLRNETKISYKPLPPEKSLGEQQKEQRKFL